MSEHIKDDLIFKPYANDGFIATVTFVGGDTMTVRYGGKNLFTNKDAPYEVRLPDGEVLGSQTADNIWAFIRSYHD